VADELDTAHLEDGTRRLPDVELLPNGYVQLPKAAYDVLCADVERFRDRAAVVVSMTIDAAEVGKAWKLNGRETAAFVNGYWHRHCSAVPRDYVGRVDLRVRVAEEHLGAVTANGVKSGASMAVVDTRGEFVTLRMWMDYGEPEV
jgi:hypothetical protein